MTAQASSHGGHLVPFRKISFDEIREYLSSTTMVPSTLGRALESMHDGTHGSKGGKPSDNADENRLRSAGVINCVATLNNYGTIPFVPCSDLRAFAKKIKTDEGTIVIASMRHYEQWATRNPVRGLAAVYTWMRTLHPGLSPIIHDESDDAQAFVIGKGKVARDRAAAIIADSTVVLGAWVEIWNRRVVRYASRAA